MENQMQIFEHEELGKIRAVEIDGQPWFAGKDATSILGYTNASKALIDHVDDEDKLNNETLLSLGQRGGWVINESGLYSLILSSKLPAAKTFKRWLTSEVLPSIRRHGAYVTDSVLDKLVDDPKAAMEFFNKLKDEREQKAALEKRIEEAEPKARYFDTILQCPEAVQVSIIAKDYGYSAMKLNQILHAFRFQYKVGKTWLPYQEYADKGYTVSRTYQINETKSVVHTCFTQKGRFFIYNLLKREGILPLTERTAESQQISLD